MPRAAALLLLLTLSTPFWDLGHPLWEVDDARYAEVPREMLVRGDWLTPTLNFMEYIERFEAEWQACFCINIAKSSKQSVAFSSKRFSAWVAKNQDLL